MFTDWSLLPKLFAKASDGMDGNILVNMIVTVMMEVRGNTMFREMTPSVSTTEVMN